MMQHASAGPHLPHEFMPTSVKGWSRFSPKVINAGQVISSSISKRMFCLLDRDYPFTLSITYYHPQHQLLPGSAITSIIPVFVWGTKSIHTITRRYRTLGECLAEQEGIVNKQDALQGYYQKLADTLMASLKPNT